MRHILVKGVLLAVGLLCAAAGSAQAAGTSSVEEQIQKYAIDMRLQQNGTMHVRETIDYDFGANQRHGIERYIINEFSYTGKDADGRAIPAGQQMIREYPVDNVKTSSPTGAPDENKTEQDGDRYLIRIGDPDRDDITGKQTYVIDYDLKGTLNGFSDHQEEYWNAVGDGWSIPINNVTVTLSAPAAPTKLACYQGNQGSTDTCPNSIGSKGATYKASRLESGQGMTIVASYPTGTFSDVAPILKEKWSLQKAFSLNAGTGVGALAAFGVLAGGAGLLVSRRGRDEQYLAVTPGLEPGLGQDTGVRRVGMRRAPVAVQFQPPDGMRPGQLGTLIDEEANVVDVTATIVDLAVRGFLRIEEVEKKGWFRAGDWRLVMIWPAPTDELHDYEMKLLKAIFDDRQDVLLSDLKQHFASDLSAVQSMLYQDVTRQGWFRGNPSTVRTQWQFAAGALILAGAGLTWLLAAKTHLGLIGVGVVLAGIVGLILAPRMPARTAKGTALLAQARGFELYLSKAEANQITWEEGQDIFSRYLPYAIVFGVAERWAKVFQDLAQSGASLAEPNWYVGSGIGHGLFNYYAFAGAMDSFTTTTSGSIAAPTPSSSGGSGFGGGGFSGGGGGGGGGGSW